MYRTSAERRHNDVIKALRKQNICYNHYGFEYYDNLHQYSKNKIHCSCPMCRAKTSKKSGLGGGKGRMKGKNYKPRDKKIWEMANQKLKEYESYGDIV